MQYYNEKIETMPKPEMEKLQYQELKQLVTRLYANSPFYSGKSPLFYFSAKTRMEMRGIDPLAPRMRSECSTI